MLQKLYINGNKMSDAIRDAYNEYNENHKESSVSLWRHPTSEVGSNYVYIYICLNNGKKMFVELRLESGDSDKWFELYASNADQKELMRYLASADLCQFYEFDENDTNETIASTLYPPLDENEPNECKEPFKNWLDKFDTSLNLPWMTSRLDNFVTWLEEHHPDLYKDYSDNEMWSPFYKLDHKE